ncbi:cysteine desulfurase family protein [Ornithobacterium rhinotracheale]|uniref:cysteine desulfurase n=2 Tax=Ornithobacterium rhinotracheale TaxID=28251 RepID=I3ZXY3_ORNRL|nr:cysteine desulfurase family protein [Ornithobacterium rhinotracheale]AFL96567.1 cysteine desulfurase family protein [Ornithobacterium rhinotracheale DSM 15997]AIP98748.1 cysteine desulfurase [Ornithobacterium rhinotracheale ORT-UMN 88]KGB67718.1 cysteine desulfurase [Ornithobacterium rhinotracheale H06-030791]MCK0194891.1 cysteine desulfurase [Ornithobacterium rhinotracheale]MCK0200175.1 cysteine desulfurase [Ornithobacterium rhinotracheale]
MKIYFDNAATTQLRDEVIDYMASHMRTHFGNPSSTHFYGRDAKALIESTRKSIAKYTNTTGAEIIFTSCGTEANNLIIRSCVDYLGVERIITSPLEHKCVAETIKTVEQNKKAEIQKLRVLPNGDLDLEQLEELLKDESKKTLVSLMHANNEIGNIYDIEKIGNLAHQYNALFHTDMVQTLGHYPISLSDLPVDFASSSAHKYHGPKGVGFAFIRKGTGLKAQITGGGQERNMRSGTENLIGIMGMGKAFEIANEEFEKDQKYILELKEYMIAQLKEAFPDIVFNGRSEDSAKSLYAILSVLLPFKDSLIGFELDLKGIAVSQGSACSSGAAKVSDVIDSIVPAEVIEKTTPLRISFSHFNTKEEIDYFVEVLKEIGEKF